MHKKAIVNILETHEKKIASPSPQKKKRQKTKYQQTSKQNLKTTRRYTEDPNGNLRTEKYHNKMES